MTKVSYTKKLGKFVANDAKETTNGSSIHVIPTRPRKWSIVNKGKVHVLRTFATKKSAVSFAKKLAGEIIVHNSDGTMGDKYVVSK